MITACSLGEPKVEEVNVSPKKLTLYPGELKEIEIEALYDDGQKQTLSASNLNIDSEYVVANDSKVTVTNSIEADSIHTVKLSYEEVALQLEIEVISNPLLNYKENESGDKIIMDPNRLDIIVNKELSLSKEDEPINLVVPSIRWPSGYDGDYEKKYMREEAATALEELFEAANEAGHKLYGVSGYRSYDLQKRIFADNVNEYGSEQEANKISARPGESEHHTGLVMDVSSESVGTSSLVERFGESPEGKWVAQNCADYGFIIRYLKGKEEITGYNYEPWHLRYVGVELAKEISSSGLTMEEYFERFLN